MYDDVVSFTDWGDDWIPNYNRITPGVCFEPYLFALVMDELTRHIEDDVPCCMPFANDILLVDETARGVNVKFRNLEGSTRV